jgi:hypothetical protein
VKREAVDSGSGYRLANQYGQGEEKIIKEEVGEKLRGGRRSTRRIRKP